MSDELKNQIHADQGDGEIHGSQRCAGSQEFTGLITGGAGNHGQDRIGLAHEVVGGR